MKKGLESVEVWMWLVAGLVLGGLIFGAGYVMLNHWIHNSEVAKAQSSYGLLKSSLLNTCGMGPMREESIRLVFTSVVNNISIHDENYKYNEVGSYGSGHELCIDIDKEGLYCENLYDEPNACKAKIEMETLDLDNPKSLLYVINGALGRSKKSNVYFEIKKNSNLIKIETLEEFIK